MVVCPFLSFAQERMLFLDKLNPGNPAQHERGAVQISGLIDFSPLEQSVQAVIGRHEILRTSFTLIDDQPSQLIVPSLTVSIPIYDLQEQPDHERKSKAQQVATMIVQQPFDLETPPLWRLGLICLGPEDHLLVLSMHHIISDGDASIHLFFREVAIFYANLIDQEVVSLPDLPIQYRDFACWQRQMNDIEEQRRRLAYWKQQLKGVEPVLQLPLDHPRPPLQTYAGASHTLVLSQNVSEKLRQLSRQTGAALQDIFLAAFNTLLYRYTGQEDICIGAPVSGRQYPGTEPLIGYFGNPVVLRTDLAGNPRFCELLTRVQTMLTEADRHQAQPFQKLVEELKPERNLSTTPFFQVLFVMREERMPVLQTANLTLTPMDVDSGVVPYDWALFITATEQELIWRWEYNTDLFENATIVRLAQHLHCLLESIVADPNQPLSELNLLTTGELQQLLVDWNQTQADYPALYCHQLVERQAEQTPNAIAVLSPSAEQQCQDTLTYAQLNAQANQLAHYLQTLGVGNPGPSDSLVGICFDRSPQMMIAILGILKVGAAYVPLDLAYPQDRLAYMVDDANLQVLLTTEALLAQSSVIAQIAQGRKVICLDREWATIAQHNVANPSPQAMPAQFATQLAYVLYTSGSTGKPKGVAMGHAALLNLIWWQRQHTDLAENSEARTLQFVPISFDVSFQEIFATWSTGGTLVLLPEATRRNPEALLQFLIDQRIARLFLPFVALQQLAEVAEQRSAPLALREVITAGEQLQITPAIANWFKQMPACTLYNHYGPTESHVVTAFRLPKDVTQWLALPPIGRPIHNVQTYILNVAGQPAPIGTPGELYLGGNCLAREYLHQPELTANRFISNPFGAGRLYKTGDAARYLADGNIEFLGRLDNQVKIRGFRVELGEIETVLGQHPDVRECVVSVREDVSGQKRLVAYIVPTLDYATAHAFPAPQSNGTQQDLAPVTSQLDPKWYAFLKERLPEHMIPTTFVLLSALPLTPSGKINRRGLPAPSMQRPELERPFVPPQTEVESKIAAIWQSALQIERIGVYDNFFALGGHSLLLTHVQTKLAQTFDQAIPIVSLFQNPTIHALAQSLTLADTDQSTASQNMRDGAGRPLRERLATRSFAPRQREQRRQIRAQRERERS